MEQYNNFPDIEADGNMHNPTIYSPNSHYKLSFYLTKEDTIDVETYKKFLDNAISRFRKSITYKHYKGHLMTLGMDRCQFHGNINSEMATIEMHHNMMTIFDIALILSEYTLKKQGYISSFDLVLLLKQEHRANRIPLVMLSLTPHQLYHNTPEFFIHPNMCFGNWYEFLKRYHEGITPDVAVKLSYYFEKAVEEGESTDANLLNIRNEILGWNYLNQVNQQ